jgi:tetratricopeptide (TPR) repeat protein
MKKITYLLILLSISLMETGCKKFLDEKPDTKLAVPVTLTDFQALLDNYSVINYSDPGAGEIAADNYFLNDADYAALSLDNYKRQYTWQNDRLFSLLGSNDWFTSYRPVFTANTILEGLNKIAITGTALTEYNNVKGQACFVRGKAFLQAALLWAPAYDAASAASAQGIPIRLGADFNQASVRSSLKETYDQILNDFRQSIPLLPVVSLQAMRPSRPAAYAMLARTYLAMRKYDQAELYADSCLQLFNTLLDYNKLNASANFPIAQFNAEVIKQSRIPVPAPLSNTRARIDQQLYSSYAANDLRKTIFFKAGTNGSYVFKGSYEGGGNLFSGVATDEVYLMRAECRARAGKTDDAMKDLNTLLVKRFKAGTFIPLTASDSNQALTMVLTERRKELLMRGLRWMDLKRLNKEGLNITLKRSVAGQDYTLPPNDLRYALPLPEDIIQLTGMAQNPR